MISRTALHVVRPSLPLVSSSVIAMLLSLSPLARAQTPQTPAARTQVTESSTTRVVAAANVFLSTLDEKQRAAVVYKFDDQQQRARWSNFPTGVVPRGGLPLKDLDEAQRTAVMQLLGAALSPQGLEKVQQIMQGDETLKSQPDNGPRGGGPGQGRQGGGGRGRGGRGQGGGGPGGGGGALFGKDLYYISFLGTPSEKEPWMLQFGGHHLALNITIVGEKGVLTPSLTGAQPATYQVDGKTVRPLGRENDKAFALLGTLDETQKKQAVLTYNVNDLVLGPGQDGRTIQPEGLKVSAMNKKQRDLLIDLIGEWSRIVTDGYATARMEEITAGLDETYFAWSGPTTVEPGKNGTSYYRIQGPKLVIEYAPQRSDDHIHAMYRDPTNDYGRALLKR